MAEPQSLEDDFAGLSLGSYRSAFLGDTPPPSGGAAAAADARTAAAAAAEQEQEEGLQRYLVYFLHRYLEFRVPEVEALAEAAVGAQAWANVCVGVGCMLVFVSVCVCSVGGLERDWARGLSDAKFTSCTAIWSFGCQRWKRWRRRP